MKVCDLLNESSINLQSKAENKREAIKALVKLMNKNKNLKKVGEFLKVVIETEEIYLTKYATMVASAGKHLHMEKPGGVNLSDFENLINILKSKKSVFSVGYMYRFNPVIRKTIERIKSGEFG